MPVFTVIHNDIFCTNAQPHGQTRKWEYAFSYTQLQNT